MGEPEHELFSADHSLEYASTGPRGNDPQNNGSDEHVDFPQGGGGGQGSQYQTDEPPHGDQAGDRSEDGRQQPGGDMPGELDSGWDSPQTNMRDGRGGEGVGEEREGRDNGRDKNRGDSQRGRDNERDKENRREQGKRDRRDRRDPRVISDDVTKAVKRGSVRGVVDALRSSQDVRALARGFTFAPERRRELLMKTSEREIDGDVVAIKSIAQAVLDTHEYNKFAKILVGSVFPDGE